MTARLAGLALIFTTVAAGAAGAENRIFKAKARAGLETVIASANSSLDIRLPRFDDEALQRGAELALSRGARVRVIASRAEKISRETANRLRRLGIQVRWAGRGEARFVVADSRRVALGSFDGFAQSLDTREERLGVLDDEALGADFSREFEHEWGRLSEKLPRDLALKDALEALPDPRDSEPRVRTKRRNN